MKIEKQGFSLFAGRPVFRQQLLTDFLLFFLLIYFEIK